MMATAENLNEDLVKFYEQNLTYKEISSLVSKRNGIDISANAIQKRLKRCGVASRRGPTLYSTSEIKGFVKRILDEHPISVGYRYVTDYLRQKGINVRRDMIMKIMRDVDPDGIKFRRRRRIRRRVYTSMGPNHVWHIDGYDKLKPYGFPIHGCIDGYSRKVLWLEVGPTNNDPEIVAQHFITCVEKLQGCPLVLQADPGTENSDIGAIQCTLRDDSKDIFAGLSSFKVVKSTLNQRIEAWWSMLRRHKIEWWINFFRDLENFGLFSKGNRRDLFSIRYCFMPLLQTELDNLRNQWNKHHISRSRQAICPGGRPTALYDLPSLHGAMDCICRVSSDDIIWLQNLRHSISRSGSEEFDEHARRLFRRHNWSDATHWSHALDQYFTLATLQTGQL